MHLLIMVLTSLIFCFSGPVRAEGQVEVVYTEKAGTLKVKGEEFKTVVKTVDFKNKGPVQYVLKYQYIADPDFETKYPDRVPYIGNVSVPMSGLELTGAYVWCPGGFLGIEVNGNTLRRTIAKEIRTVKQGGYGEADVTWEPDWATVTARFVVLPGDDKIYVEIAVDPKAAVDSLKIRLLCGSFITKEPDRWFSTSARTVRQSSDMEVKNLNLTDEPWVFYYDTQARSSIANCALAYIPEEVKQVTLDSRKSGRLIWTSLDYPPSARKMHFVIYTLRTDYKNQEEAFSYLMETGRDSIEKLKSLFQ